MCRSQSDGGRSQPPQIVSFAYAGGRGLGLCHRSAGMNVLQALLPESVTVIKARLSSGTSSLLLLLKLALTFHGCSSHPRRTPV